MWPFVEAKVTGDRAEHNLLDRPRDKPRRTAIGVASLTFFFTLFAASSTDVLANFFKISLNEVLWFFRFAVFVVPTAAGVFAYYLCQEMSGVPGIGRRKRAVVITRSAEGEYESVSTAPRPGDGEEELAPTPVPGRIDLNGELEPVEAASSGRAPHPASLSVGPPMPDLTWSVLAARASSRRRRMRSPGWPSSCTGPSA